jgi:hypothetical protein
MQVRKQMARRLDRAERGDTHFRRETAFAFHLKPLALRSVAFLFSTLSLRSEVRS